MVSDGAIRTIVIAVIIAFIAGGSAPWWWKKLFPTPPAQPPIPTSESASSNPNTSNGSSSSPTSTPKRKIETEAKPTETEAEPMRRTLDLASYCRSRHGNSAIAAAIGGDAYAWRCMVEDAGGNKRYFDMDMDDACQMQYGSSFKAAVDNLRAAESWRCIPK